MTDTKQAVPVEGFSFEFKAWAPNQKELEKVMEAMQASLPERDGPYDPLTPGRWTATVNDSFASVTISRKERDAASKEQDR